jgi:hypothetical protein
MVLYRPVPSLVDPLDSDSRTILTPSVSMTILRRRWVLVVLLLVLSPLLLGAYLWLKPDAPGTCTQVNFAKIEEGMTREQAVEILGPPNIQVNHPGLNITIIQWQTASCVVRLEFDSSDQVIVKAYGERSFGDRLRYWWLRKFGTLPPF